MKEIVCGDTLTELKKLPSNFIDVGVTSPPYNKGEKNKGWLVKNVKYKNYVDKKPEEEYRKNQINVLNEVFRVTKPGGSFFYNHKLRWDKGEMFHPMEWLIQTNWSIRQELIWDRMIAANIRGWRFWQIDERIFWLYKPKNENKIGEELKSKHALLTSIWRFPPERNNNHPAPFPLNFPLRVIHSILSGKKGIVLDPYNGSGTTCVAAKLLGHDYIGIDISKEYCSMSNKRLKNHFLEEDIMNNELKNHFVSKTFKQRKMDGSNTGKFKKNNTLLNTFKGF